MPTTAERGPRKTRLVNEIELAAGLSQTPNYRYADVVGNSLFVAGRDAVDRVLRTERLAHLAVTWSARWAALR